MSQTINTLPEKIKSSMIEVSKEQIFLLRLQKKSFIVIKSGGKLYVAFLGNANMLKARAAITRNHKCRNCANFYNEKLRKLCPKVADFSEEACRTYTRSDEEAIRESKRIEKYPFIKEGMECVNSIGSFIVAGCSHFKENAIDEDKMNEKERSRQWYERERELSKEFERQTPGPRERLYNFGYISI